MSYMRKIRIMLEAPEKAENIGTVIRNIYSFDSGTLVIPKEAPLHIKVKSACGTGNKIQIQKVESSIEFLKNTPFRKIGFVVNQTQQHPASIPITSFASKDKKDENRFKDNDLLVFGAEGSGMSSEAIALCDKLVTIPMMGHMACLNIANTTGIALYEILRQKIERGEIILSKKKKLSKQEKIIRGIQGME